MITAKTTKGLKVMKTNRIVVMAGLDGFSSLIQDNAAFYDSSSLDHRFNVFCA